LTANAGKRVMKVNMEPRHIHRW